MHGLDTMARLNREAVEREQKTKRRTLLDTVKARQAETRAILDGTLAGGFDRGYYEGKFSAYEELRRMLEG